MTIARIEAPAKLNLGLELLGKRPDGYHEIRTVMQAISLADTISATLSPSASLTIDREDLPIEKNLATIALAEWSHAADSPNPQLALAVNKRIPAAAGLGGASSDAAATLRLAQALLGAKLDHDQLLRVAQQLGSDVPFFLGSATALASGRGEQLQPLPPIGSCWFVLVTPDVQIRRKTASMYGSLISRDFSDGSKLAALSDAIDQGKQPEAWQLTNTFERVLLRIRPDLSDIPDAMRTFGANRVSLTGAGPTWYAMVDGPDVASALAGDMQGRFPSSLVNIATPRDAMPTVDVI
jgi:4-diphosphocytidyl-2-C-methyl-D-erythritol kinase